MWHKQSEMTGTNLPKQVAYFTAKQWHYLCDVCNVNQFIAQIKEDKPVLKNLGIRGTSSDEMLEILEDVFLGKAEA